MKYKILIAVPLLAAAGCAGDPTTVPDQAGYDEAVRCAAFLEATGVLYTTLAGDMGNGPVAERAAARSAAGAAYRARAINLGAPLAQSRNNTESAIAEVAASIQQEQGRQPFIEFAAWLGRETDRCPPPPTE